MKGKLGGRTDIEEAIIPKTFALGCRRATVSLTLANCLLCPILTPVTAWSGFS